MSRTQVRHALLKEIAKINERIDMKIIKGVSYTQEARKHRFLLNQLSRIEASGHGLSRIFSIFL